MTTQQRRLPHLGRRRYPRVRELFTLWSKERYLHNRIWHRRNQTGCNNPIIEGAADDDY